VLRGGGFATTVSPTGWEQEAWDALKTLLTCDLEARDAAATTASDGSRLVDKVLAATIDEDDKMQCLIDLGVDGLLTNDPARLSALAQARSAR
jgi:hypothetical protein